MNKENLIKIIDNSKNSQQQNTVELKAVIDKYPYFQSARALYLKSLKNQNSFKYNNELKITAAYTKDRSILFEFITDKNFINTISTFKVNNNQKTAEEELTLGKPINFTLNDTYSFNQWMQLSSFKPIIRQKEEENPIEEKTRLIDKFINKNLV